MSRFRGLPAYAEPHRGSVTETAASRRWNAGGAGLLLEDGAEIVVPPQREHVFFMTVRRRFVCHSVIEGQKQRAFHLPALSSGFLPAGCDSEWAAETGEVLHLHLTPQDVNAWDFALEERPRYPIPCESHMRPVASALIRALHDPCAPSAMIEGLSMALFTGMLQTQASPPASGLAPWREKRVRERLADCLNEDIQLAALAEACSLSASHFSRAFKASTGLPPYRYLIELRIGRAKELLEHTALTVTEIAAQVGYDDPSYFGRLFAKEVGVTPSKYRRERQS